MALPNEPSVSDLLAKAGYGHERTATSGNTGKHRVFVTATGETVGHFDVFEAIEFLESPSGLSP